MKEWKKIEQGGEINQALYAHMNNKRKMKKKKKKNWNLFFLSVINEIVLEFLVFLNVV
jgi:hypothetical protein